MCKAVRSKWKWRSIHCDPKAIKEPTTTLSSPILNQGDYKMSSTHDQLGAVSRGDFSQNSGMSLSYLRIDHTLSSKTSDAKSYIFVEKLTNEEVETVQLLLQKQQMRKQTRLSLQIQRTGSIAPWPHCIMNIITMCTLKTATHAGENYKTEELLG